MREKKSKVSLAGLLDAVASNAKLRADVEALFIKHQSSPLLRVHTSMSGKTLSHFQILGKIGEGTTGAVYEARDIRLGRPVAIKVLRAGFIGDLSSKRRFISEAMTASSLNHPNIVTVYEIDEEDGVDFIVMEYVPGHTLDTLIANKSLSIQNCLRLALKISRALAQVHEAGIVHRDLKPANIKVTSDEEPKVLDFGLAKRSIESSADKPVARGGRRRPITIAGTLVGTIDYMSPEQVRTEPLDGRSDIFSLGTILYEMVTRRRPFQRPFAVETMHAILVEESLDFPSDVPPYVATLIRRCLHKDPAERFQTARDLSTELEVALELIGTPPIGPATGSLQRLTLAIGLASVVLAGLLLFTGGYFQSKQSARANHTDDRSTPLSPHKPRHDETISPSVSISELPRDTRVVSNLAHPVAASNGVEADISRPSPKHAYTVLEDIVYTLQMVNAKTAPVNDQFEAAIESVAASSRLRLDPLVPMRVLFFLALRSADHGSREIYYRNMTEFGERFFSLLSNLQAAVQELGGTPEAGRVRKMYNDILDNAVDTYPWLDPNDEVVFSLPSGRKAKLTFTGYTKGQDPMLTMNFKQYSWGLESSCLLAFDITSNYKFVFPDTGVVDEP
jgi:serine/threonine protein kinase